MANIAKDVKTRPAGINDKFEIAVMDINNVVENKKAVLKAKGIKITRRNVYKSIYWWKKTRSWKIIQKIVGDFYELQNRRSNKKK